MKHIYVTLFAAALCASFFSCEEKTSSEEINDRIEESSDSIKKTVEAESKKTPKNNSDAH